MNKTKTCHSCGIERTHIAEKFLEIGEFRRTFGTFLIYIPIFFLPVVVIIAFFTWASLKLVGAQNLKSFLDFAPDWRTHRYRYKTQITQSKNPWKPHLNARWFWFFNCSLYCPLSVALFEYIAYMVKIVENWWCPFYHNRKPEYSDALIDRSYWHAKKHETYKLHPEDRDNPIWNDCNDPKPTVQQSAGSNSEGK